MKKKFIVLVTILGVLVFQNCKKESEEIISNTNNQLNFKARVNNYGMLEFNSLRDFNEAIKY